MENLSDSITLYSDQQQSAVATPVPFSANTSAIDLPMQAPMSGYDLGLIGTPGASSFQGVGPSSPSVAAHPSTFESASSSAYGPQNGFALLTSSPNLNYTMDQSAFISNAPVAPVAPNAGTVPHVNLQAAGSAADVHAVPNIAAAPAGSAPAGSLAPAPQLPVHQPRDWKAEMPDLLKQEHDDAYHGFFRDMDDFDEAYEAYLDHSSIPFAQPCNDYQDDMFRSCVARLVRAINDCSSVVDKPHYTPTTNRYSEDIPDVTTVQEMKPILVESLAVITLRTALAVHKGEHRAPGWDSLEKKDHFIPEYYEKFMDRFWNIEHLFLRCKGSVTSLIKMKYLVSLVKCPHLEWLTKCSNHKTNQNRGVVLDKNAKNRNRPALPAALLAIYTAPGRHDNVRLRAPLERPAELVRMGNAAMEATKKATKKAKKLPADSGSSSDRSGTGSSTSKKTSTNKKTSNKRKQDGQPLHGDTTSSDTTKRHGSKRICVNDVGASTAG